MLEILEIFSFKIFNSYMMKGKCRLVLLEIKGIRYCELKEKIVPHTITQVA